MDVWDPNAPAIVDDDPIKALSDDELASRLDVVAAMCQQISASYVAESARRLRTARTDFVAGVVVGSMAWIMIGLLVVLIWTGWRGA